MRVGAFARLIGLGCLGAGCQLIAGDFEVVPAQPPLAELPRACLPDSGRCTGAVLEECAPDRKTFQAVEECASPNECDPTARACHPCVPGEYACNGQQLLLCDAGLLWQPQSDCLTAELCSLTPDRRSGQCVVPICDVGQHECQGDRLLRCAPGRDEWELLEACADAAHCDAQQANTAFLAGEKVHCQPLCTGDDCYKECTPGSMRCAPSSIPEVQQCSSEGRWIRREVCVNRALCDGVNGRCLPPACFEREVQCRGQKRESCSVNRAQFDSAGECATGEICEPGGCVPGPCIDGAFRCSGRILEQCAYGAWQPRNVCRTPLLCFSDQNEGRCLEAACEPGGYECDGPWMNACSEEGDALSIHSNDCSDGGKVAKTCSIYSNPDPEREPAYCRDL
ncbi:MAG TPA: hypothetical protein VGK73_11175 [Polyangiaceae bacterium]